MKQGELHNLQWILFLLGLCCLMASPTLSNTIKCDPKIHYTVKNKTTGETLKCILVRHCPPGKEPKIPCGTDIDVNAVIGQCKTCDDGSYSSTSGPEPCQTCHSSNCSKDQIAKGTCSTVQDNSYCACKDGLGANGDGTACEVTKQQNTTTKLKLATTNKTTAKKASTDEPTRGRASTQKPTTVKPMTQRPSTHKPTTKKGIMNITPSMKKTANYTTKSIVSDNQKNNNELAHGLWIAFGFVAVVILLVLIYKVSIKFYKRCISNANVVLVNKEDEMEKLGQQEEEKESDSAVNKFPYSETLEGLQASLPDRSVSSDNAICAPASPNSDVQNMASYRKLENADPAMKTLKVDMSLSLSIPIKTDCM